MDFCGVSDGGDGSTPSFTSSVISSGGSDPTTAGWGARRLNLTMADVQETIQEGRAMGFGVWNILGNTTAGVT
jgi:hypothetical protein